MSGITRDEWIRALSDAGLQREDDQSALTINEFGAMVGMKRDAARRRLEALVTLGRAVKTHKWVQRIDGRRFQLGAYRLTDQKKKR